MKYLYKNILFLVSIVTLISFSVVEMQAKPLASLPQDRPSILEYAIDQQPLLGELIVKAGLAPMLSGTTNYTFLVPPEAELNALKNESAQRVRTVLSGHILKGKYLENDLKDGASVETLAGTKVVVCRKKDYTLVNGVRIISSNTEVKNGIIHKLSGSIKS